MRGRSNMAENSCQTVCGRYGATCDLYLWHEGDVIPIWGRHYHLGHVARNQVQQRDLCASSTGAPVPLEEGGWQDLLRHGVHLPGNFCWDSDGVCCVDLVGPENGRIVVAEGVGLGLRKLVVVYGHWRHKALEADGVGHGDSLCCVGKRDQS